MSIGQLKVKKRIVRISPEYYFAETKHDGHLMVSLPFDGEAFLHWMWRLQNDQLWMARRGKELVAAAIDYITCWTKEPRLMTEERREWKEKIVLFSSPSEAIELPYIIHIRGKYIRDSNTAGIFFPMTVLETTKVRLQLRAEEIELVLPPGRVSVPSPLLHARRLEDSLTHVAVRKQKAKAEEKLLQSLARRQSLAQKLNLSPAKIHNLLVAQSSNGARA